MATTSLEHKWNNVPWAPLAYGHRENLISSEEETAWLSDISTYADRYPKDFLELRRHGRLDLGLLKNTYHTELRFLPRSLVLNGLQVFAKNILHQSSPSDTLIYLPSESDSAYLFYLTMAKLLPDYSQFGTVLDTRHGLRLIQKNGYAKKEVGDAKAFHYVDDWVLSGQHMSSFLTTDVAGRFYTHHLAVSDAGINYFNTATDYISPSFLFRVTSSDAKSFYPTVPIFGFHKIPDRVPSYYASGEFHPYSIFGRENGDYICLKTRLVNHRQSLV